MLLPMLSQSKTLIFSFVAGIKTRNPQMISRRKRWQISVSSPAPSTKIFVFLSISNAYGKSKTEGSPSAASTRKASAII